jgi:hypothetical protein
VGFAVRNKKALGYLRVSRVGGPGGDSFLLSPVLQSQGIEPVCQREGL